MARKTSKPRPAAPPVVGDALFFTPVAPEAIARREIERAERDRVAAAAAAAHQAALNDTLDPVAARDAARRAARLAQREEATRDRGYRADEGDMTTADLPIFTDATGRPLGERPEPPGPGASTEEKIAYMRARSAYVDAAQARGSRAFDRAFREALTTGEGAAVTRPRREAFIILSASTRHPPRWSWRPVGAKRSRVTGLASREAAIESLRAAGFRLVDRPAQPSKMVEPLGVRRVVERAERDRVAAAAAAAHQAALNDTLDPVAARDAARRAARLAQREEV